MEALVREFLAVLKANTLAGGSITGLIKVCQPRIMQIYADFGRIRVNTYRSVVLGAFTGGRLGAGSLSEVAGTIV